MNPYDVLGVPSDASPDTIKAAYRTKAKTLHPDGGGDTEAFQQLSVAHRILSDSEKRRRYDETGATEDAADPSRAQALQKIYATIGALVAVDGAIYRDLVAEARSAINLEISRVPHQRAQIETNIGAHEKLRRRFTVKKGPNFIGDMIDGQIATLKATLGQIDETKKINRIALDILADAEFQVEPQPVYQRQQNIFGAAPMSFNGGLRRGLGL